MEHEKTKSRMQKEEDIKVILMIVDCTCIIRKWNTH